jgi:hypothetical protein
MSACHQHPAQTILQHGEAVATRFNDLIGERRLEWRLPAWFIPHHELLLSHLPSADTLAAYHIYHDCAKPYCRMIDEDGRQHFPNHAQLSASIWRVTDGREAIAELIQRDMDCHLMKPADLEAYSRPDLLPTLLLTALAEIHANAELFGGIDSTSFKIKWKALDKLGKHITSTLKESS